MELDIRVALARFATLTLGVVVGVILLLGNTPSVAQTADTQINRERIIALEERQTAIQEDVKDIKSDVRELTDKVNDVPAWVTLGVLVLTATNYLIVKKAKPSE